MNIDIAAIMAIIPHRYPFLLVDRVIQINVNDLIVGIKNVTFNEPQFTGHFPAQPIMPGVLIIEALAQVSAILVAKSLGSVNNKEVYLLAIEQAKFRRVVVPGDTMYLHSKILQSRTDVWKFVARAEVDNQIVAESRFTAMIKDLD